MSVGRDVVGRVVVGRVFVGRVVLGRVVLGRVVREPPGQYLKDLICQKFLDPLACMTGHTILKEMDGEMRIFSSTFFICPEFMVEFLNRKWAPTTSSKERSSNHDGTQMFNGFTMKWLMY
jgi:hypothetical protein